MDEKIKVRLYVDSNGYHRYEALGFDEYCLESLAKALGVSQEQFALIEDEKLVRRRMLSEENKRLNTEEAIRRRTDFNFHEG